MEIFFKEALQGFSLQSPAEIIAAALAIAYLVLAMRQNAWCWPCALLSTALYTWVFFDVSLFMESLLNLYYMGMAIYGFHCWRNGRQNASGFFIHRWPWQAHALALALIANCTLVSGYFLSKYTQAAWPYLDSFTSWGAVVTTYMVARKVFENWYYWLVVDSLALYLYLDRGLYATAFLMMIYLALVLAGIVTWGRALRAQEQKALLF